VDDETITNRLGEILGQLPTFAWRPFGPDPTDLEIGLYYGAVQDKPDRGVGISVYSPADQPDLLARRVQFDVRGGRGQPFGADRLAGILFTVLDHRPRGSGFASILRTSFTRLGADTNGRDRRTENYLITLDNQEATP